MSTENENALQKVQKNSPQGINLFDPQSIETAQRAAKIYAYSELVPDMYQVSDKNSLNKAMGNCIIALEIASRIGASPLMVMQNMVPIYGKPTWSSTFLIASVNTCGRFDPLKYHFESLGKVGKITFTDYKWNPQSRKKEAYKREFDGREIENLQCYAWTTQKGSDEVLKGTPISIEMAIKEGWYTKNGSKWTTMPKQMLQYRAASFWTKAYAPEISMGMQTAEEVSDTIDIPYEDVTNQEKEKEQKTPSQVDEEIQNEANKQQLDPDNVRPDQGQQQEESPGKPQGGKDPAEKKEAQQKDNGGKGAENGQKNSQSQQQIPEF